MLHFLSYNKVTTILISSSPAEYIQYIYIMCLEMLMYYSARVYYTRVTLKDDNIWKCIQCRKLLKNVVNNVFFCSRNDVFMMSIPARMVH